MPRKRSVRLRGKNIVLRNLDRATGVLFDDGAIAAVTSAGLIAVNEAKRLAPVVTGTLRRSIHVGGAAEKTPDFQDTPMTPQLPGPRKQSGLVVALIGTNLIYARLVELGINRRVAKPYLRPALDTKRGEMQLEMANVLNMFLDRTLP